MTSSRARLNYNATFLDSLVFPDALSKKDAYLRLTKQNENQYYPKKIGLLQKNNKGEYILYYYKHPDRNDHAEFHGEVVLSENSKHEIRLEPEISLQDIILIQKDSHSNISNINLHQSIKKNKIILNYQINPYAYYDNFIYVSFIDDKDILYTQKTYVSNIAKIRAQANQTLPFTFMAFILRDPATYKQDLIAKIKISQLHNKIKNGSTYLVFNGHCEAGSDVLRCFNR